jgi:hypothetical protein
MTDQPAAPPPPDGKSKINERPVPKGKGLKATKAIKRQAKKGLAAAAAAVPEAVAATHSAPTDPPSQASKLGKGGQNAAGDTPKRPRGRPAGVKEKRRRQLKTDAKSIADHQKACEAVTYRAMGYSYEQIAEQLGYSSPSSARNAVVRILQLRADQRIDEILPVLQERLEMITMGAAQAAMQGDNFAAKTILDAHDRYMKMFGLEKPTKVALTTPDGTEATPVVSMTWNDILQQVAITHKPVDPAQLAKQIELKPDGGAEKSSTDA